MGWVPKRRKQRKKYLGGKDLRCYPTIYESSKNQEEYVPSRLNLGKGKDRRKRSADRARDPGIPEPNVGTRRKEDEFVNGGEKEECSEVRFKGGDGRKSQASHWPSVSKGTGMLKRGLSSRERQR